MVENVYGKDMLPQGYAGWLKVPDAK